MNSTLREFSWLKECIVKIIDWFYIPVFRKHIPLQTFRYAACGGFNTGLDIFLFFIYYNFILNKKVVHLGILSISPHIASFLLSFPITFTTGFLFSKYITFSQSILKGRIQLFRYGVTVCICLILNYVFLKLFVDYCGLYPTPSKILTTGIVIIYSYFSQRFYTFKMGYTSN
jgi:putative flippase GtrA